MMKNKQRKITDEKSIAPLKKLSCTLPLNLQKVYVMPSDKLNSRKGLVPVRIFLTADQLAEIISLNVNLTLMLNDWLQDSVGIYQVLLRGLDDDDSEEQMALNDADEDNGDREDAERRRD